MAIAEADVAFQSGEVTLDAYFVRPDGDGPFPGVVAIHEAFGLNENMRDIARRFAREGYATLAVDLFSGRNRMMCMFRLLAGIQLNSTEHQGIQDLQSALTFLAERPEVDSARLGAIGFCMGGSLAMAWACTDERLKVVAPFYAMNPRPMEAVARSCPVVGSYPGRDFTASSGRKLARELRRDKVPHDIKIYPGARHSFFNNTSRAHDPAASEDAWARTLDYFRERIG